jgi:phage baseplate assembly protein W
VNRPNVRAWRFDHPDLDPSIRPGLQIDARGGIATIAGDDAVRQSLLLLLSTTPGERVYRPEYGCLLARLVFAPNDDTTAGLAIHYVRQAVERWEPRVEILGLDARRDPDVAQILAVELSYRVRASGREETLVYAVDLGGGR